MTRSLLAMKKMCATMIYFQQWRRIQSRFRRTITILYISLSGGFSHK